MSTELLVQIITLYVADGNEGGLPVGAAQGRCQM